MDIGSRKVNSLYLGSQKALSLDKGSTRIYKVSRGNVVHIGEYDYPYVKIGNLYWLAENLDYVWEGLKIGGNGYVGDPYAYYPNGSESYGHLGEKYGVLYNLFAINYLRVNSNKMLPEGWRVPSKEDFENLFTVAGGIEYAYNKLVSVEFDGTDDFGFSLKMAGYYFREQYGFGQRTYLGTNSFGNPDSYIFRFDKNVISYSLLNSSNKISLRLCKDA